jgi:hypothetical protein
MLNKKIIKLEGKIAQSVERNAKKRFFPFGCDLGVRISFI